MRRGEILIGGSMRPAIQRTLRTIAEHICAVKMAKVRAVGEVNLVHAEAAEIRRGAEISKTGTSYSVSPALREVSARR
jgi:L-asparaginase/Glu-tRNA(Gln) amidotransferase subunit D